MGVLENQIIGIVALILGIIILFIMAKYANDKFLKPMNQKADEDVARWKAERLRKEKSPKP